MERKRGEGAEQVKCLPGSMGPEPGWRKHWDGAGTREACLKLFGLRHFCYNSIALTSGHLSHQQTLQG